MPGRDALTESEGALVPDDAATSGNQTLTVRDNRTGQEYEIAIADGTIKAADLAQIKTTEDEPGLAT